MAIILGFDVYGTLIDTAGVTTLLQTMVGDKAVAFSNMWREKQLEYSFRRGLMQNYQHFAVCTRNGLDYTCEALGISLSEKDKTSLMAKYKVLPSFEDVKNSLPKLQDAGFRLEQLAGDSRGELVPDGNPYRGLSAFEAEVWAEE